MAILPREQKNMQWGGREKKIYINLNSKVTLTVWFFPTELTTCYYVYTLLCILFSTFLPFIMKNCKIRYHRALSCKWKNLNIGIVSTYNTFWKELAKKLRWKHIFSLHCWNSKTCRSDSKTHTYCCSTKTTAAKVTRHLSTDTWKFFWSVSPMRPHLVRINHFLMSDTNVPSNFVIVSLPLPSTWTPEFCLGSLFHPVEADII